MACDIMIDIVFQDKTRMSVDNALLAECFGVFRFILDDMPFVTEIPVDKGDVALLSALLHLHLHPDNLPIEYFEKYDDERRMELTKTADFYACGDRSLWYLRSLVSEHLMLFERHPSWFRATNAEQFDPDAALKTIFIRETEHTYVLGPRRELIRPLLKNVTNRYTRLAVARHVTLPGSIESLLLIGQDHLLLAGGAALFTITGDLIIPRDYDIYAFGFPDVLSANAYVMGILSKFRTCYLGLAQFDDVINVELGEGTIHGSISVQIMLYTYNQSPAHILNAFDIQACKVGMYFCRGHGLKAVYLPTWMESMKCHAIWLNPAKLSASYAYRIAKYWAKGFDVELFSEIAGARENTGANELLKLERAISSKSVFKRIYPSDVLIMALQNGVPVTTKLYSYLHPNVVKRDDTLEWH
jgi:hypothetical protein